MNYCEACSMAFPQDVCPMCGRKKLREPQPDDYCLLAEEEANQNTLLESILKENDLSPVSVPWGSGVESVFAMSLKRRRLFVPYHALQAAKDIMEELAREDTERIRADILQNLAKLNIDVRTEKKIKKRLKLQKEADLGQLCVQLIRSAPRITDARTSVTSGAHYLFIYTDEYVLSLDSDTYEVLSLKQAN